MDEPDAMTDTVFAPLVDEARARDIAEILVLSRDFPPHLARVAHAYAARWFHLQMRFACRDRPGMAVEALWRSLERVFGAYGTADQARLSAQEGVREAPL
ncbi:hypothetical protein [Burkholderia gladioli]|uniref:hypothetical protein n=2 Tax=Burkholderia gladioli TaxID=28095 RepID=UPI003F796B50